MWCTVHFIITLFNVDNVLLRVIYQLNFTVFMHVTSVMLCHVMSRYTFFWWGYLKSRVYTNRPRTIEELKLSIRQEFAALPQKMLGACDAGL